MTSWISPTENENALHPHGPTRGPYAHRLGRLPRLPPCTTGSGKRATKSTAGNAPANAVSL